MSKTQELMSGNPTGEVERLPVSEIQSLSTFLKTHFPKCVPVPVTKGSKKPFNNFKFAFSDISTEQMWERWDKVGMHIVNNGDADLAISLRDDIIVIDFDDTELAERFNTLPAFCDTVCANTKKGKHFYFKKTPKCQDWVTEVRPCHYADIDANFDIICNYNNGTGALISCFPSENKEWLRKYDTHTILPIPDDVVDKIDEGRKNKVKVTCVRQDGEESDVEICRDDLRSRNKIDGEALKKVVGNLCDKRADSYGDWTRVCWAIFNVAHSNGFKKKGINLIHTFSRNSVKYDEFTVQRFINQITFREAGLGLGYLLDCLKTDNIDKFKNIMHSCAKHKINETCFKGYQFIDDPVETQEKEQMEKEKKESAQKDEPERMKLCRQACSGAEYDVAKLVQHIIPSKYVYAPESDKWYYFHNHRWNVDCKGITLRSELPTQVLDQVRLVMMMFCAKAHASTDDDEKARFDMIVKALTQVITKLKQSSFQYNVIDQCKLLFRVDKFEEKLDESWHLLGFENGIYDLDNNTFRDGQPEDMITLSTKYDFIDKEDSAIQQEIYKYFESIMVSEPVKEFLLHTLAYSLHGDKGLEWFISWIGEKGANGKGTTTSLVNGSFGGYMLNSDPSLFTTKNNDSSKPRPEWMRLKGKRIDILQEADEDQKLQPSAMKPITGRDKLAHRGLYGDTTEFKPQLQPIMCNNNQPEIAGGNVDGGMRRRLINIPFPYKFCNNPKFEDGERQMNPELKTKFEKDTRYHQQFMLILLKYFKKYVDAGKTLAIPDEVKQLTDEYINNNDSIMKFLLNECNITRKSNDMVIAKDLYDFYKNSDGYKFTSKSDFQKAVIKHGFKYIRYKGTGNFRDANVYVGLSLKEVKCMILSDDEYDR